MRDVFSDVDDLKSNAKSLRDRKQYERANKRLDEAIALLQSDEAQGNKEKRLSELADCYGMKGGVFRRWERLDDAIQMYRTGLDYEEQLGHDSYNLSNWIALSIAHGKEQPATLSGRIAEGADLVGEQLRLRPSSRVRPDRSKQWWAWADFAMFNLLLGRSDQALDAYGKYRDVGARREDYQTTIEVLELLEGRVAGTPLFDGFDSAIRVLKDEQQKLQSKAL